MTGEDYQKIKQIFNSALDLAPAERETFVANNCREHPDLSASVHKMLAAHLAAEDFFESPAVAYAPDFFDEDRSEQVIGNYKILRELGRGGMGAVFLAERHDAEFEQEVALKLIKRGMDTDEILLRFRRERQILAGLDHPNIARLLDGGTTGDGLPFFVMEYVNGSPISHFCREQQLDLSERLTIFRQVCSAVAYAHQHLVVHRDLKPSNILVTKDSTPKLLDFGIAKLMLPNEEQAQTQTQFGAMTPDYASPEQLHGEKITTATDTYSLGKVLAELVAADENLNARELDRDLQAILQTAQREESGRPVQIGRTIFRRHRPIY